MKKFLLFISIISAAIGHAQPCGEVEGLKPVQLRYTFDGRPGTIYPMIPSNWNRFYKLNETTGDLTPDGCAFPCCPEVAGCVCYAQGVYFRRVTAPCDPTPCGDFPLTNILKTDTNSQENKWSQSGAWMGGQVPIMNTSPAILITKPLQVDANLAMAADHWIILTKGISSIAAGNTIINNSLIRVLNAASLENFGILKGTGKVYGNLTNSGTLSPGNSPGKFTVTGNYTATNTAVHEIEIASQSLFDTVNIEQDLSFASGNAIINGILNVTLLNGYVPTIGDTFKIFNYASATGNFSVINSVSMPLGLGWDIAYNATDITLTVVGAVLPLHFMNARAAIKEEGVEVTWTAENEVDVKEYEVERSVDGISFNRIGLIKPSTNKNYSWYDASPTTGNNYYRVKAIDLDGKFMYSGVLLVKTIGEKHITIYPNPVKRGAGIQIALQNRVASSIEVINTVGQIMYRQVSALTGTINISVPGSWPAGQYVLKIKTTKGEEIFKLLLQ